MSTNQSAGEPVTELKPCPFCGCADIFVDPDERGSGGQWVPPMHVGCTSCKAEQQGDTVGEAMAAWNRRSIQGPVLKALTRAVLALAHVSQRNRMYHDDYMAVNAALQKTTGES